MEVFLDRAEEHQAHKMALQYVLYEAKKELQRSDDSPAKTTPSPNPQRRRKSSFAKISPVRARNTRRRSSGHLDVEVEPEQQLLRNLGVSTPADVDTDVARNEVLDQALADRSNKLEIHTENLQSTTESSISAHLLDAQVALQLLRDSLLADTPYRKVQFLDPEIEGSVKAFEEELLILQEKMEGFNLHDLQARNLNRDAFVGRWAR